jgi:alkylation response protein AidB-like acyl-CoA dehydrogenase
MRVPGVTVRPLYNLLGLHWFNEVIFDGVEVSRQACLGEENKGWQILTSALGIERITVYRVFLHWRLFQGLLRWARGRHLGPLRALARQRLADLAIGFEVARLLLYRAVDAYGRGEDFRAKAAMVKLFNSELAQRLYQVAVGFWGPMEPSGRGRRGRYGRGRWPTATSRRCRRPSGRAPRRCNGTSSPCGA